MAIPFNPVNVDADNRFSILFTAAIFVFLADRASFAMIELAVTFFILAEASAPIGACPFAEACHVVDA